MRRQVDDKRIQRTEFFSNPKIADVVFGAIDEAILGKSFVDMHW